MNTGQARIAAILEDIAASTAPYGDYIETVVDLTILTELDGLGYDISALGRDIRNIRNR